MSEYILNGREQPLVQERLSPPNGTLIIGRKDLVAHPLKHDVFLYPNGTEAFVVPLSKEWQYAFNDIQMGALDGGVHLRSNLAQSQLDIADQHLSQDGKALIVTLINHSPHRAVLPSGHSLKIGNPYCLRSPLEGDDLQSLAEKMVFPSGEVRGPILLRKGDEARQRFVNDPLISHDDLLEIPLTKAHPNIFLNNDIDLSKLPSGPDRLRLHAAISINGSGIALVNFDLPQYHHEPDIQLASTPAFSMPPATALLLTACVKNIRGECVLVPHSASNIHRSEALAPGTSHHNPGDLYSHRVITESYNYIYQGMYPISVLCKAFNLRII